MNKSEPKESRMLQTMQVIEAVIHDEDEVEALHESMINSVSKLNTNVNLKSNVKLQSSSKLMLILEAQLVAIQH